MISTEIQDGGGTGERVKVTSYGQLVVAPLAFSEAISVEMTVINTANNILAPDSFRRAVITGIVIGANRNVSNTDGAVVELYEADSATSLTVLKPLFSLNVIKNQIVPIVPINMITNSGVWLNAKTDDAEVTITVLYYFVE